MTEYQVTLQHSGRIIQVNNRTTLLDSLQQQQVPLEYQCQRGYCGACRTQLLQGKISYPCPPLACQQVNEILPCYCIPQSDLLLAL